MKKSAKLIGNGHKFITLINTKLHMYVCEYPFSFFNRMVDWCVCVCVFSYQSLSF